MPWRRKWQPSPVLLPGKFHGLRSPVGYSPWGCKESDTTERLHFHFLVILESLSSDYSPGLRRLCHRAQSCLTLRSPVDWSPPGSSVHEISQARILEGAAISYSRGSSWPSDWTRVSWLSCIGRQILYHGSTLEVPSSSPIVSKS